MWLEHWPSIFPYPFKGKELKGCIKICVLVNLFKFAHVALHNWNVGQSVDVCHDRSYHEIAYNTVVTEAEYESNMSSKSQETPTPPSLVRNVISIVRNLGNIDRVIPHLKVVNYDMDVKHDRLFARIITNGKQFYDRSTTRRTNIQSSVVGGCFETCPKTSKGHPWLPESPTTTYADEHRRTTSPTLS